MMDYFDFDRADVYINEVGKRYVKGSESAKWYLETREKLYNLVSLLNGKLDTKVEINYKEQPNKQAGRCMYIINTTKPNTLPSFTPVIKAGV